MCYSKSLLLVQSIPFNRETDKQEIRLIGTTDRKQIFYIEKSSVNWDMPSVNREKNSLLTEQLRKILGVF